MKITEILEAIKKLTAVELVQLVENLKTEFGIDDSMLSVGSGSGSSSSSSSEESSSVSSFKVIINNVAPDKKTELIKTIKTLLNIGLGDSKSMVDKAAAGEEVIVKSPLSETEAKELCQKLTEAGASASASAN